jgi:putative membrane protein
MGFILRAILNGATIYLASRLFEGVELRSVEAALVAGLVLGVVNALVRPVLVVLTFPLTLVTLGLFLFVLNAFCLWLTSALVPGFTIHGFWPAFLTALLLSVVSWVLTALLSDRGRVVVIRRRALPPR